MGMTARPNNTRYTSVQLSQEELDKLKRNAEAAGTNKNAFVREWIATLPDDPQPARRR